MMLNNLFISDSEKALIERAISDGDHTVGFYDTEMTFFYIYQNCRPEESYSYSQACGFEYAVARFDGVKDVFLFD